MTWLQPLISLLALALSAQVGVPRDPAQTPPGPATATLPLFSDRDVRLIKLERDTQSIRDEVRQQLAEASFSQEQATQTAKQAWADATKARQRAEEAVRKYVQETLPGEIGSRKIEIDGAKALLEAAKQRQVEQARRDRRGQYDRIISRLGVERSQFEVEQAETELAVLERYIGPKENKRLSGLVALATDEEVQKQHEFEVQNGKLERRKTRSARLQARTPEDYVVALLDEVVAEEAKIGELSHEIEQVHDRLTTDPDHATNHIDQIRAKRDAIQAIALRIKASLTEATKLAEEIRQLRQRLFNAEKLLLNERRLAEKPAK